MQSICSVLGCVEPSGTFYWYPTHTEQVKAWLDATGHAPLLTGLPPIDRSLRLICKKHFEQKYISGGKLMKNAIPTLYLPPADVSNSPFVMHKTEVMAHSSDVIDVREPVTEVSIPPATQEVSQIVSAQVSNKEHTESNIRNCCIPGCTSTTGGNKMCLFRASDAVLLKAWDQVIPKAGRLPLTSVDEVCQNHFKKTDLSFFMEQILPDGTRRNIKRGAPILRNWSVPCFFPNPPNIPASAGTKRKPRAKLQATVAPKVPKTGTSTITSGSSYNEYETTVEQDNNAAPPTNVSKPTNTVAENIDNTIEYVIKNNLCTQNVAGSSWATPFFEQLKVRLHAINCSLPHKRWIGMYVAGMDKVIFAEWKIDYMAVKKVVVNSDSTAKVIFGKVEIHNLGSKIHNVDELMNLLTRVAAMSVCESTVEQFRPMCLGFLPNAVSGKCNRVVRCLPCKKNAFSQQSQMKKLMLSQEKNRKLTQRVKKLGKDLDLMEIVMAIGLNQMMHV